jgi:hypothetical protein
MDETPAADTVPVATYRERRFDQSRVSELFRDRIRIRADIQLGGSFDISVPLKTLNPDISRYRLRHKSFWHGISIAIVSYVIVSILLNLGLGQKIHTAAVLIGGIGMSGVCVALATFRKMEYVSFSSYAGVVVFDLCRTKLETGKFDSFVESVSRHIAEAGKTAELSPSPY